MTTCKWWRKLEYPAKTTAYPQVIGNFLTCTSRDSNPGSGERQLALSGNVLDHTGKYHDKHSIMECYTGTSAHVQTFLIIGIYQVNYQIITEYYTGKYAKYFNICHISCKISKYYKIQYWNYVCQTFWYLASSMQNTNIINWNIRYQMLSLKMGCPDSWAVYTALISIDRMRTTYHYINQALGMWEIKLPVTHYQPLSC